MTKPKITINHFSTADAVPGQGVGSAYRELLNLFKTNSHLRKNYKVTTNKLVKSQISHYHTVDPWFLLTTFLPGRGVKVGYVHFLPETLVGSLDFPKPIMKIVGWYIIQFYRQMDKLVVVNPSFEKELIKAGLDKNKIVFIPNFVNPKNFYIQTTSQIKKSQQRLNVDPTRPVILGVGQVQTRKGVLTFAELAKQNPKWQFIWAGGFSFGAVTDGYKKLNKIVKNPPLNLHFTGIIKRDTLNDYYNMADIFFLPSYNELFPMSILEAFAVQKPVVTRSLSLYKDVLLDSYVSGRNNKQFQEILDRILRDKKFRNQLSEKSKRANMHYSPDNIAEIWDEFYRSLINGSKK